MSRDTKHYNRQMIIAVGFKVNSERAVQFEKWWFRVHNRYIDRLPSGVVNGYSEL